MMNRFIITMFLLGLAVTQNVLAKPRTYDEILKSKELRICYPKWLSKDTLPSFLSPYMEIAVAFAKKKKLEPKLKEIVWGDQFKNNVGATPQGETYTPKLFDTQECDLFSSSISPLEWRKKLMDMNWIYISSLTVVVRKEEKKKFKSVDDLKRKTVYVVPNTTYHDWILDFQKTLKDSEKMKIVEVLEGGTIAHLLKKDADFIIFESQNALYAKNHISSEVAIAFKLGKPRESGWGFPKGAVELKAETGKFFEEEKINPDSEVNKIYKKYFGLTLNEYEKLQYSIISN